VTEPLLNKIRPMVGPLFWLSLAFGGGILLASSLVLPPVIWLGLAGISILAQIAIIWTGARRRVREETGLPRWLMAALVTVFFLGAARYQVTIPQVTPDFIAWYNDRPDEALITGTLVEPPDVRDSYVNLKVQVEQYATDLSEPRKVGGVILVRVSPGQAWNYGDRVRLRGLLMTPPEDEEFSYRDYLMRQGIHAYMNDAEATLLPLPRGGQPIMMAIYHFKARAFETIFQMFPDPEASLLAGILLGMDNNLPAPLKQAYKDTGTAHVIAISGFNISIIAGLFAFAFSRWLGPRKGALAAVVAIGFYTILVGAEASVVRAAIMGGIGLLAQQVGRKQIGINTLAIVGGIMALFDPHILWDVGFQLSMGATLGLILYSEPLQAFAERVAHRIFPNRIAQTISALVAEYFLLTLAAQFTTLPIMAWHFGRISLIALLANPFILPAQPTVMVAGGLALALGLIYLPLGQVAAFAVWPFLVYTNRMVELFAMFPHGVIVLGNFAPVLVLLFYAAIFTWSFGGAGIRAWFAARGLTSLLRAPALLASLAVVAVLTVRTAVVAPDGNLHLTFLDAGSADAILIQTPGGRWLLINGGPSPSRLSDGIGRRLPPLDRRLDWLIVASTQEEQLAALPRTLDRFPPEEVLWAGNLDASFSSRQLDSWIDERSIPVTQAEVGQEVELGRGAVMRVMAVSPRGCILLVEWGGFRALLPVGVDFDSLEALDEGEAVGPVTLLLLAESGYGPSNPPAWLANLRPQISVLSVAAGDPNGLPAPAVVDLISEESLLRTDRSGWIEVITDGTQVWVEKER
jgi:competence protein ComEC